MLGHCLTSGKILDVAVWLDENWETTSSRGDSCSAVWASALPLVAKKYQQWDEMVSKVGSTAKKNFGRYITPKLFLLNSVTWHGGVISCGNYVIIFVQYPSWSYLDFSDDISKQPKLISLKNNQINEWKLKSSRNKTVTARRWKLSMRKHLENSKSGVTSFWEYGCHGSIKFQVMTFQTNLFSS